MEIKPPRELINLLPVSPSAWKVEDNILALWNSQIKIALANHERKADFSIPKDVKEYIEWNNEIIKDLFLSKGAWTVEITENEGFSIIHVTW